jgi:phenylalanyl-tRNA synthetase alpha chain
MEKKLERIYSDTKDKIAKLKSEQEIRNLKVEILGRKGSLTSLLKNISKLSEKERPIIGRLANEIKNSLEDLFNKSIEDLREKERSYRLFKESIDVTLPGRRPIIGRRHPITLVMDEIIDIFTNMGFKIVEGPEVELDFYNFEALNIPREHPARDMQDTFYISNDILLRTHTSPVQIRTMEHSSPPIKIIAPGKVYRCDSDISHTPMFHQIEGLMVDEKITFSHLKGVLTLFIHQYFGEETKLRFRPSFFPFTEPSAEVDIECVICQGKGCRVCSQTGWLEILGSGMVHPEVFRKVKYDPEKVAGFAFGIGIERIAMLKYRIDNIRLFYENNIEFLEQF